MSIEKCRQLQQLTAVNHSPNQLLKIIHKILYIFASLKFVIFGIFQRLRKQEIIHFDHTFLQSSGERFIGQTFNFCFSNKIKKHLQIQITKKFYQIGIKKNDF